jgi:hypothetical protein
MLMRGRDTVLGTDTITDIPHVSARLRHSTARSMQLHRVSLSVIIGRGLGKHLFNVFRNTFS